MPWSFPTAHTCARVVLKTKAIGNARRYGINVLQRTSKLHTDRIIPRIAGVDGVNGANAHLVDDVRTNGTKVDGRLGTPSQHVLWTGTPRILKLAAFSRLQGVSQLLKLDSNTHFLSQMTDRTEK